MTLGERRLNSRLCYDEAVAAIRRQMIADCRGAEPLNPAEIELALASARSRAWLDARRAA